MSSLPRVLVGARTDSPSEAGGRLHQLPPHTRERHRVATNVEADEEVFGNGTREARLELGAGPPRSRQLVQAFLNEALDRRLVRGAVRVAIEVIERPLLRVDEPRRALAQRRPMWCRRL